MTGRPPLFSDRTLAEALAEAEEQQRFVLVDVTASWCQPCKAMDETTWRSPEVERWVSEKAIAIQLDADDEKQMSGLSVLSVPTMFLFADGKELDRKTGACSPAELLEWLNGAAEGRTELDRMRAASRNDPSSRLNLAQALLERGLDDEALEEFAWLWEHALEVEPAWFGVRMSFLVEALRPLIARSTAARHRFAGFRNAAAQRLFERAGFDDWLALNDLLGESDLTLAWLERVEPTEARRLQLDQDAGLLRLLERRERWDLLGRITPEDAVAPLQAFHERVVQILSNVPDWVTAEEIEDSRRMLVRQRISRAAHLVRGLLAVGREADAQRLIAEAKKLDGSPEMEAALEEARK